MSNLAQRRGAKAARRNKIVKAKRLEELNEKLTKRSSEGDLVLQSLTEKLATWDAPEILRIPDDAPFKASDALLDVVEMLVRDDDDIPILQKQLTVATIAWNATLLPPDERRAEADKLLERWITTHEQGGKPQLERDQVQFLFAESIDALMERKLELYPHDRRYLSKVDIEEGPDGVRVIVQSELYSPV